MLKRAAPSCPDQLATLLIDYTEVEDMRLHGAKFQIEAFNLLKHPVHVESGNELRSTPLPSEGVRWTSGCAACAHHLRQPTRDLCKSAPKAFLNALRDNAHAELAPSRIVETVEPTTATANQSTVRACRPD